MSSEPDADLTLPSILAALPVREGELQPVLTLVFHPDVDRIGETARLAAVSGRSSWILGRRSPAFARVGRAPAGALDEPHVSRQALEVTPAGAGLKLRRLPATSRCRVAGSELRDSIELSREQLHNGVPILLAHSVVMLLRLAPAHQPTANAAGPQLPLLGSSAYMSGLRHQIAQAADCGLDVLVSGETGTGKELVAQAIHRLSRRARGPMLSVNMAAIPVGLAAATLFGHDRGAYTGATGAGEGYFSRARGGTLFLDEIGATPAEVQPQLLRALQQREIQSVGGTIANADVRVISATDAELEGDGCDFKAALRHRLGACEIPLLPLREHPEDIGELLVHYLYRSFQQAGREALLPGPQSSERALAAWAGLFHALLRYSWPGNVRELANFASQIALCSDRELTVPDNIRFALNRNERQGLVAVPVAGCRRDIRDIEQAEFDEALQASGYQIARVARHLGVSRQAVYRRLDESPRHRLAGQVPLDELAQVLSQHGGDAGAAALELKVSPTGLRARLRASGLAWF